MRLNLRGWLVCTGFTILMLFYILGQYMCEFARFIYVSVKEGWARFRRGNK